jgi:predicted DNA-binding transcriptional regulator AlpA
MLTTTTTTPERTPTTPASRRLLTAPEVADQFGISVRTLWRWVATGEFPQPIRWNRKLVRWDARAVEAHIDLLCGEREPD